MSPNQARAASIAREILATHRAALDLIQVGAYVPGSDPKVDAACRVLPELEAFLRQGVVERTTMEDAVVRVQRLQALAGGAFR
jgi:flagellar biosynthesis/type III secretory pathway ATPase